MGNEGLGDPGRWQLTILPMPKRLTRARGLGLCGGCVAGLAEGGRGVTAPQWWADGEARPLAVNGKKHLTVGRAHGREIPGSWQTPDGGAHGAVAWRRRNDGTLTVIDLHPDGYASTIAVGTGGGAFAGNGAPNAKKGERGRPRALFWRPDGTLVELPGSDAPNASANGTDGESIVGQLGRTAVLWRIGGNEPVMLGEGHMFSAAAAVRDGEQVGSVVANAMKNRAALWRGDAKSFVDLTPRSHQMASASDCAAGHQVGHCGKSATTKDGSASSLTRAALWSGSAASHVDLHACVPAPWNASAAWAIEVDGGVIRVAGDVTQIAIENEGKKNEVHISVAQAAALWEARLGG